jgi:hypothetical protein
MHARTHLGRVDVEDGVAMAREVDTTSPELSRAHFVSGALPAEDIWRVEEVVKKLLLESRAATKQRLDRA